MPEKLSLRTLSKGRHAPVLLFLLIYVGISTAIRCVLLARAGNDVTWDASLIASFAWGLVFDLGAALWFSLPLTLGLTLLPRNFFEWRLGKLVAQVSLFVVLVIVIFNGVAEWFFWDEFGTRFNFIAVDYLVYTTEVLGNIRESYPLHLILPAVTLAAVAVHVALWRSHVPQRFLEGARAGWKTRWRDGAIFATTAVLLASTLSLRQLPDFENNYNRSLAQDGPWSLFAAFWNNELDYREFYLCEPLNDACAHLREELVEDGSVLLAADELSTLRMVVNDESPITPNIIQITVESLDAKFLGAFDPASTLTPNLDALAKKSLLFDNFYATGTRTVRGMEALTMSIPPTPGRSIVKRPENSHMFTLGSVLRTRGYENTFLYGGYGYFDNMNAYFAGNGFRIVDRASVADEDVTFATAWGACDEDLFRWTLREADRAAATQDPFHFFVMTTSNHRPYAFPGGRIDLPSKTGGRNAAVKYTDFAIGDFIRQASTRPWFKDTVFVIVADHCASSAGKRELPPENYHIPLIIYAPGGQIESGRVSTLTSQMDYAPTLLGLLHWSYASRFFGHDVRRIEDDDAHALIATYQLLGHLEKNELTILKPKHDDAGYLVDAASGTLTREMPSAEGLDETIAFYQVASELYRRSEYTEISTDEQVRFMARGRALSGTLRVGESEDEGDDE